MPRVDLDGDVVGAGLAVHDGDGGLRQRPALEDAVAVQVPAIVDGRRARSRRRRPSGPRSASGVETLNRLSGGGPGPCCWSKVAPAAVLACPSSARRSWRPSSRRSSSRTSSPRRRSRVSVTVSPSLKEAEHVFGQSIPAGLLVTWPAPETETSSVCASALADGAPAAPGTRNAKAISAGSSAARRTAASTLDPSRPEVSCAVPFGQRLALEAERHRVRRHAVAPQLEVEVRAGAPARAARYAELLARDHRPRPPARAASRGARTAPSSRRPCPPARSCRSPRSPSARRPRSHGPARLRRPGASAGSRCRRRGASGSRRGRRAT